MAHNRKYVPSGIDLVGARIKNYFATTDQDKVEQLIIDSKFLDNAPFKWIGLSYLFGIKNDLIPRYGKISKRYSNELPIDVELNTAILEWADKHDLKLSYDIFMIGALEALIHVGKKYKLPIDIIVKERTKYGNIPEIIDGYMKYTLSSAGPSKLWLYLNAYCAQPLKDLGIYEEFQDEKYEEEDEILKLVEKYPNEIFLNWCPNCGHLKETPKAKQCLECMKFINPVHELGLKHLHRTITPFSSS